MPSRTESHVYFAAETIVLSAIPLFTNQYQSLLYSGGRSVCAGKYDPVFLEKLTFVAIITFNI